MLDLRDQLQSAAGFDGRGNGKIIQELVVYFHGAGWNDDKSGWCGAANGMLCYADRDDAPLVNLMTSTMALPARHK